jgi:NAD(P)-dependent dehydrogenase (short-subunit alcohol dehydrogenase family)
MSILITGGTKGIGRGIAERFAAPGVTVFLNYVRDDSAAESTAAAVRDRGATPILLKRDITRPQDCAGLLSDVAEHTDRLDQLVHAAVYPYSSSLMTADPVELERAVALNGTALVHLCRAALALFVPGSTVFFLSSRGSKVAVPNYGAIGGPKAMGETFVRYLAIELADLGVRTHVVSASLVLTDAVRSLFGENANARAEAAALANPMKRNVTERDVANVVHFLASPEAEMLSGREIFVDGGAYSKPG